MSENSTASENVATEAQAAPATLRADSVLPLAIKTFDEFMLRKGFSENTIKAFRNDLKIVTEFIGGETKVHQVTTAHLNDYIDWLQAGRGKPCSPKSLARRITTIKVFFGWLHGVGVIGTDPAAAVVQQPARPPLPEILRDEEVQKLQRIAQDSIRTHYFLLVDYFLHGARNAARKQAPHVKQACFIAAAASPAPPPDPAAG